MGVFCQLVILALGLVIPRLFLVNFGSETNGLITSINDIFVYISLLEAGIGAATVQALYKPIVNNDKQRINEILSATSVYYKRTGIVYFIVLLLFSAIYPALLNSDIGYFTIAAVIFFTGIGNVINFFFQGKYKQLLLAEGKAYIITALTTGANIIASLSKIVLIMSGFGIVAVQAVYFVLSMIQMVFFEAYIRKKYGWLSIKETPDFGAISQKNAVLIHQISGLVFRNTDVIILSLAYDLKTASVYIMYNLIFTVMEGFITTINDSVTAALGQEYNRDKKSYAKLYNFYELGYFALCFIVCTVVYAIIIPFIRLYTAGVNDINYIIDYLPLAFVIMKFLNWCRTPAAYTITFAGRFIETRGKALAEAVINIAVSLLLVKPFGIFGVVFGSAAAFLFSAVYSIWYVNAKLCDLNYKRSIARWAAFVIAFFLFAFLYSFIKIEIAGYFQLVVLAAAVFAFAAAYYTSVCFAVGKSSCVSLLRAGARLIKAKLRRV